MHQLRRLGEYDQGPVQYVEGSGQPNSDPRCPGEPLQWGKRATTVPKCPPRSIPVFVRGGNKVKSGRAFVGANGPVVILTPNDHRHRVLILVSTINGTALIGDDSVQGAGITSGFPIFGPVPAAVGASPVFQDPLVLFTQASIWGTVPTGFPDVEIAWLEESALGE